NILYKFHPKKLKKGCTLTRRKVCGLIIKCISIPCISLVDPNYDHFWYIFPIGIIINISRNRFKEIIAIKNNNNWIMFILIGLIITGELDLEIPAFSQFG